MISLNVNVSRSGEDEILTCDKYYYVNRSIFTSEGGNLTRFKEEDVEVVE